MKPYSSLKTWLSGLMTVIAVFAINFYAFAQDKKLEIDVDTKDDNWYNAPWVWVVGAAVFILLLAAILRGSGKKTG